jgi:hypothetical protein
MKFTSTGLRVGAAAIGMTALFGLSHAAHATNIQVGDFVTPPAGVNVFLAYNDFTTSNTYSPTSGSDITHGTRLQTDVPILRYVHEFQPIDGIPFGVQVIQPIVAFTGNQELGGGGLTHQGGVGDTILSAFTWLISKPLEVQYLNFTYFLTVPTGSYNHNYALNAGNNRFENDLQVDYTQALFGNAKTVHMNIELTGDAYIYGNNNDMLVATPFGAQKATLKTNNTYQIQAWLPYVFSPATAGYVAIGVSKTFGGKGTVYIPAFGASADTGGRTDETQLRIAAGSFVSPTLFLSAELARDVEVKGGFKTDAFFEFRAAKFF